MGNDYTVLYDNPSGGDGTITLKESSSNFKKIANILFCKQQKLLKLC